MRAPSISWLLAVHFRTVRVKLPASGILLAMVGALSACSSGKSGAAVEARGTRPVPVLPATVVRRDVPVYLEGIGSVVAYKIVMVRYKVLRTPTCMERLGIPP